jgi:serine/threonine-protein kinase
MIGSRLGKWILDREIGRGGMGSVYLAHEEGSGRQGAVKVLAAELARETGFLQRFQREIEVLSRLSHPNIVRFYESGAENGLSYYAMEYVDGESFEQLLQERGRLPWKEVLDAALQVCPALKHAHDHGVIHRDLKPPNLLRTPTGVIKLTDFGIAKVFAGRPLTSTGGIVGTVEYLSPEQASGKPATKRSDLYSLGAVLYTLVTGRTPFEGKTAADILHKHLYARFEKPNKLLPEIPYELDDIICQLLEKDPAKRPADSLVLHRLLDSLRRKLERKGMLTEAGLPKERTVADNADAGLPNRGPGPATLMGELMREELHRQNERGPLSRWIHQPFVLIVSFLLVVGILAWTFWPRTPLPPEVLFQRGAERMQSDNPDDWDTAWAEYFEPLNRLYPDHSFRKEVEDYRHQIDDRAALRRALAGVRASAPASDAQRFYQRGLRLARDGDAERARRVWRDVVYGFRGVASERRWVHLAQEGLDALDQKSPAPVEQTGSAEAALERARSLRKENKRAEAEAVWQALEELYRDDDTGRDILRRVREDRGR